MPKPNTLSQGLQITPEKRLDPKIDFILRMSRSSSKLAAAIAEAYKPAAISSGTSRWISIVQFQVDKLDESDPILTQEGLQAAHSKIFNNLYQSVMYEAGRFGQCLSNVSKSTGKTQEEIKEIIETQISIAREAFNSKTTYPEKNQILLKLCGLYEELRNDATLEHFVITNAAVAIKKPQQAAAEVAHKHQDNAGGYPQRMLHSPAEKAERAKHDKSVNDALLKAGDKAVAAIHSMIAAEERRLKDPTKRAKFNDAISKALERMVAEEAERQAEASRKQQPISEIPNASPKNKPQHQAAAEAVHKHQDNAGGYPQRMFHSPAEKIEQHEGRNSPGVGSRLNEAEQLPRRVAAHPARKGLPNLPRVQQLEKLLGLTPQVINLSHRMEVIEKHQGRFPQEGSITDRLQAAEEYHDLHSQAEHESPSHPFR